MRTPHALRTRRRTAAAARSTARCSPQAALRSALRSSKPEGGVQPGSSCQSPSAYAPHCFGRLRSPSSRCSCQRSGRPAGRSPAGGAARSPPSPPLAAISRPQGGPTPRAALAPTYPRAEHRLHGARALPDPRRPRRKRRDGVRPRLSASSAAARAPAADGPARPLPLEELGAVQLPGAASVAACCSRGAQSSLPAPRQPGWGPRPAKHGALRKDDEAFRREKTNRFSQKRVRFARE